MQSNARASVASSGDRHRPHSSSCLSLSASPRNAPIQPSPRQQSSQAVGLSTCAARIRTKGNGKAQPFPRPRESTTFVVEGKRQGIYTGRPADRQRCGGATDTHIVAHANSTGPIRGSITRRCVAGVSVVFTVRRLPPFSRHDPSESRRSSRRAYRTPAAEVLVFSATRRWQSNPSPPFPPSAAVRLPPAFLPSSFFDD